MTTKVEISHKTVIFTAIFLLFLWLLFEIREIIFLVYIAFILMSAFKPWADFLEKFHIPRVFSVLFIYLLIFGLLTLGTSSVIPPLVSQTIHLGESLPEYLKSLLPFVQIDYQVLTAQIAPIGENLLKVTIGVFSNVITVFSLIIISFYLLIERKYLLTHLSSFLIENEAKKWVVIISKVEERLGSWVRGQLMLGITIGIFTSIGLTILGLPYVLSLSIFAGLLEIVPIIGPIISAIPAILVAFISSPLLALATAAVYFIIQQVEANLVVPMVMKRAVGLPPLITIITLMIGAKIAGIGGALLSIPLVVTVVTVFSEYLKLKEVK